MPKLNNIKKVLVIGSGPIIIGQAAEFDYAGTQACRTLKEEGLEVVLLNSNPATIMTDYEMANRIYIEPMDLDIVKRIALEEKVDSILATLGGQTGLNLAMQLNDSGFLQEHNIRLLGTSADSIKRGEDRSLFREAMVEINEPCIPSGIANDILTCKKIAEEVGYPVIIRPAFTLGGTGGGIAKDEAELEIYAESGLVSSPVHQVLIEKSIAGWKELEFEVVRDSAGNAITICSMENFDPVGVHTGDSIVFAPALTLTDKEYQMLRSSAINIVHTLDIKGGCNVQFALHPTTEEYAVIEVNPRLSRSSALASKATGYPIAKIATRIALGYHLDEIQNEVTGTTLAAWEPVVDYVVTKIPKWPFDKFIHAKRLLGTQMKATGEIMSIGSTFEASIMKAIRSLELKIHTSTLPSLKELSKEELREKLSLVDDLRLFTIAAAIYRGISIQEIEAITKINGYFLSRIKCIVDLECAIEDHFKSGETIIPSNLLKQAQLYAFSDTHLSILSGLSVEAVEKQRKDAGFIHHYKMVDTCAGEFEAKTPYFYSNSDEENEAVRTDRKKVVVLGSGPIRIGQGIEFDYCSVHCVEALREAGYETIIINNNPETVSTDFDTSDRLYFEPLTPMDVQSILENEQPEGVICQFGGQTAINLMEAVDKMGFKILGTSIQGVNDAEDRECFEQVLKDCNIPHQKGMTVFTTEEALKVARELIYPVLLRPSYVLGGQGMVICSTDEEVKTYMDIINMQEQTHPILVDKYLRGTEIEVDAISDGKSILIPGIMKHLERAGVHSGDSHSIFPAHLSAAIREKVVTFTKALARRLNIVGLLNIQYILHNDEIYCLEVNPRSSRTIPYISKITGLPVVKLATRVILGESIQDLGYGEDLYAELPKVFAIKAPVFSFEKLHDVDTQLGPEMKSTGEVLGLSRDYTEAMFKAITASNFKFPKRGDGILLTVQNSDKAELIPLAQRLFDLGFILYATGGTSNYLNRHGVPTSAIRRIMDPSPNILDLIANGKVKMLVNTSSNSSTQSDGFKMRRHCIEHNISTVTCLDTLAALIDCIEGEMSTETVGLLELGDFAKIVDKTRKDT